MNNQQLENIIVKNFNIDEKKLRLGIASYIKEMGINLKKSSNNPLIFYQLRENKGIKDAYLESLSYILNSQTFNIYKYLLEFDLERDWANSNTFKFSANKVDICNYTSSTINRHLAVLNDLGLINKTRSNNGHNIGINYDFILDNLLINNLYNDKKFFDKLTIPTLEVYAEAKYDLNEFIQKKTKLLHKSILESMNIDFTEEQINKVLEKLYQIELNYKSKKISFISIGNNTYVYYNLKEHVSNKDVQILNYLILTDKISCIKIGGINRYRIIDKSNIKIEDNPTIQEDPIVEEKNITDEVDSGSLTPRQKEGIINTLDKFLNENDIEISDNKYKLLLKYGYYLKSRNISEFSYLAYIKEIITQKFDDNKLNYIVTDMINKNFTNLFNYLDKNNISPKTNATEIITTEVKTTQTSSNNNPLTKLTREEFAKLQEGRSGGKLYEEIDEYKAQGKTEVEYIKDKLGIDVSNR